MYSGSSLIQEPIIEGVYSSESYQKFSLKGLQKQRSRLSGIAIKALRRRTLRLCTKKVEKAVRQDVIGVVPQRTKVRRVAFRKPEKKEGFVSELEKKRNRHNMKNATRSVKLVFNRMLKVRIAHGMDPVQRAGQTKSSNEKEASIYGRGRRRKSLFMSLCKILIQLLFLTMFPVLFSKNFIVKGALNSLKSRFKPKKKQKYRSFVSRVLQPRSVAFAR